MIFCKNSLFSGLSGAPNCLFIQIRMCSSLLETPRGAEFEMVPRPLSQQVPEAGTSVYKVVTCIHNMNQGSSWSKSVALLSRASIVLSVEDKNRREYLEPQLMG